MLSSVCFGIGREIPRSIALSEPTLIVVGLSFKLQYFPKFRDESEGRKLPFLKKKNSCKFF